MPLNSVKNNNIERREYDVIVVGSGGAGATAARTAADGGARVLIVSKDPMMCTDSKISAGIVTVRASGVDTDTVEVLDANMRMGGDDMADPNLTKVFSQESKSSYQWLQSHGLRPDFDPESGKPVIFPGPMGGHNIPRSVMHENGGLDYSHACWNAVMRHGSIEYLEDAWFLDVYQGDKGQVQGGLIYHAGGGKFISVKAPSVVLACGGLTTIFFPQQYTMKGNTGDAFAIAARAGANLVDMEQIQFIAFAIASPKSYAGIGLGEPATTGFLGRILDKDGNKILGELGVRTRAECASAIAQAVAEGKGTENGACYLDLTQNAKGEAGKIFKLIMKHRGDEIMIPAKGALGAKAARFEEPWEVKPTGHYLNGGVHVNEQTQVLTPKGNIIAGLYAAGQAMGGLHGSNRLGSTSLTECLVFGRRSGEGAADYSASITPYGWQQVEAAENALVQKYSAPLGKNGQHYPIHLIRSLQSSCQQGVGPARNENNLKNTILTLDEISNQFKNTRVSKGLEWNQGLINYIEGQNMLFCAKAVAHSALARPNTVGSHCRTDSKKRSSEMAYSLTCHLNKGKLALGRISRSTSPMIDRIKIRTNRVLRIGVLRLISHLPENIRDRVLVKAWQKNAGPLIETIKEEIAV